MRDLFLYSRHLPDLIALLLISLIQLAAARMMLKRKPVPGRSSDGGGRNLERSFQPARNLIFGAWGTSVGVMGCGFLLRFNRIARHFPDWLASWGTGSAIMWALFSVLMFVAYLVFRALPDPRSAHSPARRTFLRTVRGIVVGAPAAAIGYGTFIQRFHLTSREQNIEIPGLHKDLDGLRLAQLTDIHLSPFLSVRELERAVDMANEMRAHVALVTGDFITTQSDPLDACLERLSHLKADAGIYGCMGNHEIYADAEEYTQLEGARLGMHFLRQRATLLRFGAADLNLAGVDYQRFGKPYLRGAGRLVVPGVFNVLLSHNPDVFPVAARQGFHLTVSGHTHGGQVRLEILNHDLNIARFFTPYVDGLYRQQDASIFVSRGIGTIGLPTRLGAPPEVALLRLCRV